MVTIVLLACVLASCSRFDKNPEKFAEKLEKKGLYVEVFDGSSLGDLYDIFYIVDDFEITEHSSWIDYIVFCENEDEGYFFYCYDAKSAKKIEAGLKDLMNNYRGYAEAVLKRDGNIVYFGGERNWAAVK